jgi:Ssp1 endopeptidase immunity protein Rap1a
MRNRLDFAVRASVVSAIFLSAIILAPSAAASESAGEMATACSEVAKLSADKDGQLHFAHSFRNGQCWGAFAAVQELSRLTSVRDGPPLLGICAPEQTTRLELIRSFVQFLQINPGVRDDPFAVVVVRALRLRFSC